MIEPNLTAYITFVTTSGVLSLFLFFYAFLKRKELSGARLFMLYTASQAVYIFGFAFELTSDTLEQIKQWIIVQYIGMPVSVVFGLLLVLRYTGKAISRRMASVLFVIPAITFIMVATNDSHRLFYKSVYLRPDAASPLVDMVIGEWYIVHGAYTFGCMLAGFTLLVRRWKQTKKEFRLQLLTMTGGQLIPMVSAFVYLMGVTPGGMDPVPVLLCLTSSMYIWAMISTQMFTVFPIAKDRIFESMRDGVIVLDAAHRLVEYNQAAGQALPVLHSSLVGQNFYERWMQYAGTPFPISEGTEEVSEDFIMTAEGRLQYYQVRSSIIRSRSGDLAGSLLMFIDVTEQKKLHEQLEELAYYDGLTKILNRTQFIHQSRQLLELAGSEGHSASFILFDIDYFKQINDMHGHETGDQALIHIVSICRRLPSPNLIFSRYGGEEFVMGLPGADLEQAGRYAEQLRAAIASEPLMIGKLHIPVTASFGVAQYRGPSDTLESLLRDADAALYESKRNGRNRVSLSGAAHI